MIRAFALPAICLAALSLSVAACNTPAQIEQKEDMLLASGFRVLPAAQSKPLLAQLPPHKFSVRSLANTGQVWLFADPTICHCVYAGTEANWHSWQQAVLAQQAMTREQSMATLEQASQLGSRAD